MTKREFMKEVLDIVANTAFNLEVKLDGLYDTFEEGEISANEAAYDSVSTIFQAQQVFYEAIDALIKRNLIAEEDVAYLEDNAEFEAEVVAARGEYEDFMRSLFSKDCDAKILIVDSSHEC